MKRRRRQTSAASLGACRIRRSNSNQTQEEPQQVSVRAVLLDAFILAAVIGLFYSVFLTGRTLASGADMVNLFLPMKAFTRQAFAQGVVPLWNPWTFCGAPFLATMQAAVLYPFNLPAVAFDNPALGVNLFRLLHLWWMALGVCVYLSYCQGARRPVAIACSLPLPCGAFVLGHLEHLNQMAAIAWFPWWMTGLWFCLRRPSARTACALGVCGGMQWLAGHPQQVIFTLLLTAGYLIAGTLFGRGRAGRRASRVWFCAVGGTALAGGLAFAQILPALELSGRSLRVFDDFGLKAQWPPEPGVRVRYAARFALRPEYLILAVRPHAFGNHRDGFALPPDPTGAKPSADGIAHFDPAAVSESGCYVGLLMLAGALVGALIAARRRWREHLFWVGVVALAVCFALGDLTPLHWVASAILPPLRHFRAPPRVLFLAVFALSVLSAVGWEAVWERIDKRAMASRAPWRPWLAIGPWVVVAVTFVDLRLVLGKSFGAAPVDARALEPHGFFERLARSAQGHRVFRLMPHDGDAYMDNRTDGVVERMRRLAPNVNLPAKIATVYGYEEGLLPTARTLDFLLRFNRNRFMRTPDAALLGLLNVSHVMAEVPVESPFLIEAPELAVPGSRGLYRFHRNALALPRVARAAPLREAIRFERLDGQWTLGGGGERSQVNLSAPITDYLSGDVWRSISIDGVRALFGSAREGMEVVIPSPNRVQFVDTRSHIAKREPTPKTEYLFLQAPYPGWRVRVDGLSSAHSENEIDDITALCALASTFDAPSGAAVRLAYEPWSYRLGLFISLVSTAALLALLLASTPSKRALAPQPKSGRDSNGEA